MAKRDLSVEEWFTQIDDGLRFRQQYGHEKRWTDNEKLFYGRHRLNAIAGPNLIFSNGDAMVGQLCSPNPYITVKAQQQVDLAEAPVVESLYNQLMGAMHTPDEVNDAALDAYSFGVGIIKLGYDSLFGFDGSLDLGGKLGKAGMTLSQHDRKMNLIEFGGPQPGMPWTQCVKPHDFVLPMGAKSIETAPWAIHRFMRHIDDLRSDPKFENTKNVQPTMSQEDWVRSYAAVIQPYRMGHTDGWQRGYPFPGKMNGTDDCEYVELWEIHDVRTAKVFVIASGYNYFLRNDHDGLQINGLPFVSLSFVPRGRTFWRTPPASYLYPAQKEATDIAFQAMKQRRASVAKTFYRDGAISKDDLNLALNADVGTFVKVNTQGGALTEAIMNRPAYSNQNLAQEGQVVENWAKDQIGFSENQTGEFAGARTTATETAVVNQASTTRMTPKQKSVAMMYQTIFEKIGPIIARYWQLKQEVQYIDQQGMSQWHQFTGEMMKGKYSIEVGFADVDNGLNAGRQMAMQLMQTAVQQAGPQGLDLGGVERFAASKFNDPDIRQIFNQQLLNGAPPNGPQQQQPQLPMQQPGQPFTGANAPPGPVGPSPQLGMGAQQPGQLGTGLRGPAVGIGRRGPQQLARV